MQSLSRLEKLKWRGLLNDATSAIGLGLRHVGLQPTDNPVKRDFVVHDPKDEIFNLVVG